VKVAEIFAFLGFKVDDKGAKEFDEKIKALTDSLKKNAIAASGALYALDRFVESSVRGATALANFAVQTGLSADALQQWQYAAQMSNFAMGADEVTSSIKGLQQALVEIRMGGGNPEAFRWLNVNPMNKDAFQVLGELRKGVKDLDPAFASMYLRQIGLSENFLNVLKSTDSEFEGFMKAAPVRSSPMSAALTRIGKGITDLRVSFSLM